MKSDPLLGMVVEASTKMADSTQGKVETEITLHVGGMLVSGKIISRRLFMLEHPLTDKMLEVLDGMNKQDSVTPDKAEESNELPEFIHLKDAHFHTPGQPPIPGSGPGIFWRCRLADVSGFHFGVLKVITAPALELDETSEQQ